MSDLLTPLWNHKNVRSSADDIAMNDDADYPCPDCGSTDLVTIYTRAVADELLECRACMRLYRVEHASDGTKRLVPV